MMATVLNEGTSERPMYVIRWRDPSSGEARIMGHQYGRRITTRADARRLLDVIKLASEARKRELQQKTYFFQYEDGSVKIGKAVNPAKRLGSLLGGTPKKITVLGVLPQDVERDWHTRFRHLHIVREWFRGEPELLDAIKAACD